jgi:hypothetical protein
MYRPQYTGHEFNETSRQSCCFPILDVLRNMCKSKKNKQQDSIPGGSRGMRGITVETSSAGAGDIRQSSLDTTVTEIQKEIQNTINDMKSNLDKIVEYGLHSSILVEVNNQYLQACNVLEEQLCKVKDYAKLKCIKNYINDTQIKLHDICVNHYYVNKKERDQEAFLTDLSRVIKPFKQFVDRKQWDSPLKELQKNESSQDIPGSSDPDGTNKNLEVPKSRASKWFQGIISIRRGGVVEHD